MSSRISSIMGSTNSVARGTSSGRRTLRRSSSAQYAASYRSASSRSLVPSAAARAMILSSTLVTLPTNVTVFPTPFQIPPDHVVHHRSPPVTHVRHVVHGRSAHVHGDLTLDASRQLDVAFRQGVEDPDHGARLPATMSDAPPTDCPRDPTSRRSHLSRSATDQRRSPPLDPRSPGLRLASGGSRHGCRGPSVRAPRRAPRSRWPPSRRCGRRAAAVRRR